MEGVLVGRGRAGRQVELCAPNPALRLLRFESVEEQSEYVRLDVGVGAEIAGLRLEVRRELG